MATGFSWDLHFGGFLHSVHGPPLLFGFFLVTRWPHAQGFAVQTQIKTNAQEFRYTNLIAYLCVSVCVCVSDYGGTLDGARLLVGFALPTLGAWPAFTPWVPLGDEVATRAGVCCNHTHTHTHV